MNSETVYDQVAYPGYPHQLTHPQHVAALAHLHGVESARPDRCRVLELGCGDGGNLIPMAATLPDSEFFGIDLSAAAIDRGRKVISRLGLTNIRLKDADITSLPAQVDPCDYIIAHGLYSWVPPAVQKKIFEIIEHCLTRCGVAFISYNAMPGGYIRLMLREMMLFHCRGFELPDEKIQQAKSLIQLIAGAQNQPNRYGVLVRQEWEKDIVDHHPRALFHDELGEYNSNLYFHEFMAQAASHHLQFLCEADYAEMQPHNIRPQIVELLGDLGDDIIAREQYMDFMTGRRFRQTLLCHEAITVDRNRQAERIMGLSIASDARPESPLTKAALDSAVKFLGSKKGAVTASRPLLTAALACLIDYWPLPLSFETLWDKTQEQLSVWRSNDSFSQSDHKTAFAEALLSCYSAGVILLRTWTPRLVSRPGPRPEASPLARLQSLDGDLVTTLLHTSLEIRDPLNKRLLQALDGTRDRSMILKDLEQAVLTGQMTLMTGGEPCHDRAEVAQILRAGLESHLEELARLGLLSS